MQMYMYVFCCCCCCCSHIAHDPDGRWCRQSTNTNKMSASTSRQMRRRQISTTKDGDENQPSICGCVVLGLEAHRNERSDHRDEERFVNDAVRLHHTVYPVNLCLRGKAHECPMGRSILINVHSYRDTGGSSTILWTISRT